MKTLKIIFKVIIAVFLGILIYFISWYGLSLLISKLRKQEYQATLITLKPLFASTYSFIYPRILINIPREIRLSNSGNLKIKIWKEYYYGRTLDNLSGYGIISDGPLVINDVKDSYKTKLNAPKVIDLILNTPQIRYFKNSDTLFWDWTLTPVNDCHPGNYSITLSGIPVEYLKSYISYRKKVFENKSPSPDTLKYNYHISALTNDKQSSIYRVVDDSTAVFNIKVLTSLGLTDRQSEMVSLGCSLVSIIFGSGLLVLLFRFPPTIYKLMKSIIKKREKTHIILPPINHIFIVNLFILILIGISVITLSSYTACRGLSLVT